LAWHWLLPCTSVPGAERTHDVCAAGKGAVDAVS
jgi:hypothetical protein